MTVFKERKYFVIENRVAKDQGLSYEALGLLCHLMANRDRDGRAGCRNLRRPGTSKARAAKLIKELEAGGYIEQEAIS